MLERPGPADCHEYYFNYIHRVPADADVLDLLEEQRGRFPAWIRHNEALADRRYADGKWTVKEVVGHVIDTERAFQQRAFGAVRLDPAEFPDFDQDRCAAAARHGDRSLDALLAEYAAVRAATSALFADLTPEEWTRSVHAAGRVFVARSFPFIIAGHQAHHEHILETRYFAG